MAVVGRGGSSDRPGPSARGAIRAPAAQPVPAATTGGGGQEAQYCLRSPGLKALARECRPRACFLAVRAPGCLEGRNSAADLRARPSAGRAGPIRSAEPCLSFYEQLAIVCRWSSRNRSQCLRGPVLCGKSDRSCPTDGGTHFRASACVMPRACAFLVGPLVAGDFVVKTVSKATAASHLCSGGARYQVAEYAVRDKTD
jgi:hypothetical protein